MRKFSMLTSNQRYYYIGEFGPLNIYYLGLLEREFNNNPSLKIQISTYPGFAELLGFIFPENVVAIGSEALQEYKAWGQYTNSKNLGSKRVQERRKNIQKKHTRFLKLISSGELAGAIDLVDVFREEKEKYYQNSFTEILLGNKIQKIKKLKKGEAIMVNMNGTTKWWDPVFSRSYSPALSKPLSNQDLDRTNIVNIQCRLCGTVRFEKDQGFFIGGGRSFSKAMSMEMIKLCLSFPSIKVVLHGSYFEELNQFNESGRVHFCHSLVESISYMHRSKLTLCANSGFSAFALNCASNVAVFMSLPFPLASRDVILSNTFQTYTETIYYNYKTNDFDREKLKLVLSRLF